MVNQYPESIIQRKRLNKGITQKELAEIVGTHIRQVQKWESGEYDFRKTSLINAIKLADALGIDDLRDLCK